MTAKQQVKIAVTGANGFVGSRLTAKLLQLGYGARALVRSNAGTSLLPAALTPQIVDYDSRESINAALQGVEVVIHNAAVTRAKNRKQYIKHNVDLTMNLIKAVNSSETIRHFIFISSQAAAGPANNPKTIDEQPEPVSYYGKSKLQAEELIRAECRTNYTILRPCSVYGEGDRDFLHYFRMVEKRVSILVGFKERFVSLIYIDQLAGYIAKAVDNSAVFGQTLFLSDGNCYSWEEFITTLEAVCGKKTLRIKLPEYVVYPVALLAEAAAILTKKVPLINWQKAKEITAGHWVCDNSRAGELLPIEFNGTLKHNLAKTYQWYKEKKWL